MDDRLKDKIKSMLVGKINKDNGSFKSEGLRAAAEQMINAIKDMPYSEPCAEERKRGENESIEEHTLRVKADNIRNEANKKAKLLRVDSFIEGLCSFLELKDEESE